MSRLGSQTAIGYPLPGTGQSIATSGTSAAASSAVGVHTERVVIHATEDAYINFEGTATTSDAFLPKDTYVMFPIRGGQTIRALQVSTAGTVRFFEVSA